MIDHAAMLRPRTRHRPFVYLVAFALALGAIDYGHAAYTAHGEAKGLATANEQLRMRQAATSLQPNRQEVELQRQWSALLEERTFPWARVFRSVEHASDPEIELLEFRPDRRKGTLVLKGEGRTAESVMRYLERLQEDVTFSSVYLTHTASTGHGPLSFRSFEIKVSMNRKQSISP